MTKRNTGIRYSQEVQEVTESIFKKPCHQTMNLSGSFVRNFGYLMPHSICREKKLELLVKPIRVAIVQSFKEREYIAKDGKVQSARKVKESTRS